MEDESGLELSLGLSFGASAGKSHVRDPPPDPKPEGRSSNKGSTIASESSFVNFFRSNAENQNHSGKHDRDPTQLPHGSFWTELGKSSAPVADGSGDQRYQEIRVSKNKRNEPEEANSSLGKRKLLSEERNLQKKHLRVVDQIEALGKNPNSARNMHLSTTEDGSTGENEDVAESEAEGSNSWLVSQHEDSAKGSDVNRAADFQGQKPGFSGSESGPELGKVAYGIPLSFQAVNVVTVPYPVPLKVPGTSGMPNAATFSSPCVMQLMPLAANERPMIQAMNSSNSKMAFGYSTLQLPTLETSSSWAFGSNSQLVASFSMKDQGDRGVEQHAEDDAKKSQVSVQQTPQLPSSAFAFEGKSDKHAADAGTSSSAPRVDEEKGTHAVLGHKEANQPGADGSLLGSTIRPGISPNVKFGGCGTYPDLPWVSTTAPNGKTISGVTYKLDQTQIRIVCACHGTHMSPEEFIQHASGDDSNTDNGTNLPSFPAGNTTTSAQN